MDCPNCGLSYLESYDYCKNCVEQELRYFEIKLHNFLDKYPHISLIPHGPNLIIRHKTGEEIFLRKV